ncbi:MAG: hypothetical protein AB1744_00715 [Candidatus Zixiibacteriota bacterium]
MLIKTSSGKRFYPTKAMIERYAIPFAKAGFDIHTVRSAEEWKAAIDASFPYLMQDLAQQFRGDDPALDAIMSDLPGWD